MDRSEAQLILSGLRPGGLEANEPFFAEALALVESDPELNAWWQAQQEFDRRVAARLREVPVPKSLRQRCLLSPKIVSYYPPQWEHRGLLAAAAAVAILCVVGTYWHVTGTGQFASDYYTHEAVPLDRSAFTEQVLTKLGTTGPLLGKLTTDQEEVKAWLKERKAPVGRMPPKVAAMPPIGCQKYMVGGHAVSLMCFTLPDGCEAHLFMVDKSAISNPPSSAGPQYDTMSGWNVASWSDGRMSYVLATNATMDNLKQLL